MQVVIFTPAASCKRGNGLQQTQQKCPCPASRFGPDRGAS
jgi:hypothetical protein